MRLQKEVSLFGAFHSEDGRGGRQLAKSLSRCTAVEQLVGAVVVVISSELFQLSLQVDSVPDQHVVQKLGVSSRSAVPQKDGTRVRTG